MPKVSEAIRRRSAPALAVVSPPLPTASAYRQAMRQLAGGVSVVTAGVAPRRLGFTSATVVPLSADAPRLLISFNRTSSLLLELEQCRCFGVNVLAAHHADVAARFGGHGNAKGEAQFAGECWQPMATGAPILCDALASLDCELEEVIERHSHAIVIGRVVAGRHRSAGDTLVYWRGDFHDLRQSCDEGGPGAWEPILRSRNIACG